MRLEHGPTDPAAGSAAAKPEPAPTKSGRKGSKPRPKSKSEVGKKGQASAKAAGKPAAAPLYLHLQVEMATSALCYREPIANVAIETSADMRKAR